MADKAQKIKLANGKSARLLASSEQLEIKAKATFKIDSNGQYRKLIDILSGKVPIQCRTVQGFGFQLET
jgi:hypothetical protein